MARRGKYLQIRTSAAERDLLAERAAARGQTVSAMVREAVGLDSPLAPASRRPDRAAPRTGGFGRLPDGNPREPGAIPVPLEATGTAGEVSVSVAEREPAAPEPAAFSCPECNWSTIVPGLRCPTHG